MKTGYTKQINVTFQVMIEPDEGGFHAYCPALKGLHVSGKTQAEALSNAREAALLYLLSMIKHNESIPLGNLDAPTPMESITAQKKQGTSSHKEQVAVPCA